MNLTQKYALWCKKVDRNADPVLVNELESIEGNEKEIEDRFYRDLEFGTGGLRGVIGVGTNRMNIYTVAKATQGYCHFLNREFSSPSVAIAYDSRINSKLFAETAAGVFAANGIRVYIYPELMPTPSLSFAVRYLKCSGGIVITASHNPAQYNGYKVYNHDGCQITTNTAAEILSDIETVDVFDGVFSLPFSNGLESGMITYISEKVVTSYINAVSCESLLGPEVNRDISIVYTPLNGTGISCVPRCLRENGFTNIIIPRQQQDPNGNFSTCPFPNPEIQEALYVGIICARDMGSELVLATDPDCDRVGIAVREGDEYVLINGNQMGVLLLDFVCRMRLQNGSIPERPIAIKTIVTTEMAEKVASHYGAEVINTLTGFKFIGEQIGYFEAGGEEKRYIFGFEESYGYLSSTAIRDKDAVNASLLICEMFAWYKAQNMTLLDVLDKLYAEYGYYSEKLLNFDFRGSVGFGQMQGLMAALREDPPADLAGMSVEISEDYNREGTGLPKSDVLQYRLFGGSAVTVRPSGTEPKLKIYLSARGENRGDCAAVIENLEAYFRGRIDEYKGRT